MHTFKILAGLSLAAIVSAVSCPDRKACSRIVCTAEFSGIDSKHELTLWEKAEMEAFLLDHKLVLELGRDMVDPIDDISKPDVNHPSEFWTPLTFRRANTHEWNKLNTDTIALGDSPSSYKPAFKATLTGCKHMGCVRCTDEKPWGGWKLFA